MAESNAGLTRSEVKWMDQETSLPRVACEVCGFAKKNKRHRATGRIDRHRFLDPNDTDDDAPRSPSPTRTDDNGQ